ncbi:MAG: malonyl-ACP O-methyltransferase BioC [Candidatus Omnitrophica bacterium]|nr:malonyl-ACP O-methyltransferase BioC [Candidatus Omnitrophota bacterium]
MNKQVILNNFSRYAYLYDDYAGIQQQAAEDLADWMEAKGLRRILEIGCGTGNFTRLLRNKYKNSDIHALDISEKMIEVAKEKLGDERIEFLVEDGESVVLSDKFDLITSNACFQWFGDFEKAIAMYRGMLVPGGRVLFSIFGPRTFIELNSALAQYSKDKMVSAAGFLPQEKIEAIVKRNFREAQVREVIYQETFSSLADLLRKIKYTGIRGRAFNGWGLWSVGKLKAIERAYLDKHKQIKATYQVFFCKGVKG